MVLGLKQVFHLPPRALQVFACSLRRPAFPDLPVPNYSMLSHRVQELAVKLLSIYTGYASSSLQSARAVSLFNAENDCSSDSNG